MRTSEQIDSLAAAMVTAQATMKPALKDRINPAFHSTYADFSATWEACRGPLTAAALAIWQDVTLSDEGVSVVTRLVHASGQWVEFGPLIVPLGKRDAHGVGSAASYGKRYALAAAVGIVSEDDDGNAAQLSAPTPPTKATKAMKAKDETITQAQRKRLFSIASASGWTTDQIKAYLQRVYQVHSSKDLPVRVYDQVCQDFDRPPGATIEMPF